ncbi:MAG: phage major capsid protein [Oscillospiraceae bacterium]|nr:phage major capsid protein [Oscillospiraceae bacterium]
MDFKAYLASIANMTAQQVEEQRTALTAEIDNADENRLDEITQAMEALEQRSQVLQLEGRRQSAREVAAGAGTLLGAGTAEGTEARTLESVRGSAEYEDAFVRYLRTGDATEARALLTDLVDGGTIPIPTYVADRINTSWEHSILASRIRRVVTDGQMKFPFELSATDAEVHTEGAAAPAEEVLTLGEVLITPQTIKKWITISDEALRLKSRAFLDYIYDEIENKIMLKADAQLIAAIKAAPAASSATAVAVPGLTPAALDAFTIFSALAELSSDALNPVAIMNRKTFFNGFMALADTTKRPIYNVVVENGRPVYYLNGVEVLFSDQLAPMTEIIVGDLDGAVMITPDGDMVSFVTDPYSLAEDDKIKIVGKLFAGFGVVRPKYFVRVTVTPASGA